VRYGHPPIASLLIGVTQEADLVSPGFEQLRAISNHSTLDYTLHYGERRIVLPGDALWKRLCSSSVPPDDDDTFLARPVYTCIYNGLYGKNVQSWSWVGLGPSMGWVGLGWVGSVY